MILNILVTQGIKRLFFRKRPTDFQPPRALRLIDAKKQGGCPSSMIVSSTTFMYVAFSANSWILHLDGLNEVPIWGALLIALATFFIVSFAKIYLGQNYPSDCVLSIPPIFLVIGLFYLLQAIDKATDLCPSCIDVNGNDAFCYYDSDEIIDKDPILMTRANFSVGVSNTVSTTIISFVAFALFSVASCYPVELWNKLAYFVPTLLAVYLFKNIMLCPCGDNDWRSVTSPMKLRSLPTYASQKVISFALVFFSYGTTWIVNNLLGNRTASLLTYILRTFFFLGILFQTLITLITVRLILVAQNVVTDV